MDINELLLILARKQAELTPQIEALKESKSQVDAALKEAQNELDAADDAARTELLRYIAETGNTKPHELVTFRRSTKLMYDKQVVIEGFLSEELPNDEYSSEEVIDMLVKGRLGDYLKISVTLDVRKFEADYKDGKCDWAQVETVPAPQVAIGKLGSLLIEAGEA